MSYILEALKKLEQKREQEDPCKPPAFSEEHRRAADRRRPLWPYIILAALLLNAVIIFWWMAPWQTKGQSYANQKGAGPSANIVLQREDTRINESIPASPQPPPITVKKETTLPVQTPIMSKPEVESIREKWIPPPSGKLMSINDLPASVRADLPEFRMSGHSYSADPQTRVVMLNGKVLQERQELSHGLKLEEITPDGVIMVHKGFRFRIGLDQNP